MKNVICIADITYSVVVVDGHGIPILVEDSLAILQKRCHGVDRIHCRNGAGPRVGVHALTPLHGSLVREVNPPIHQHLGGILLVCVHACRLRSPYQTLVSLLTASQVMGELSVACRWGAKRSSAVCFWQNGRSTAVLSVSETNVTFKVWRCFWCHNFVINVSVGRCSNFPSVI